ncbi:MAG: hypothetical protein H0V37_03795 [Chloroflexia bacterium]|nr:hypothetical protein [Chloroflexia bacterium]
MTKRLAGLRLGVFLLFLAGLLSPFAATGAGAQELTCDDFNSQRAAQAVLDADPSSAESLDPDGDGEACNEDGPVDGPADEPADEPADGPSDNPADEPADDPVDEPADGPGDEPSADGDAYLADIQAELDTLQGQTDRVLEISVLGEAATQDDATELNDIASGWADYPDIAAGIEEAEGYEEIHEAYLDLADTVGEAGELWDVYWAIPAENDDEELVAIEDFTVAYTDALDQIAEVQALVDDAGGATTPVDGPLDGPEDEPSADGDAYVEDVQAELDALSSSFDRYVEIQAEDIEDLSQSEAQDLAEELNEIAATWVDYPDVAFELVAPEGYEDVEDAYLDLADTVGETGELWEAYWAIPAEDDDEEQVAFDAFSDAFADAQDQLAEVQDLLDEAGGPTGPSTDDPAEEPTDDPADEPADEPAGDDADYLATVSETAADWQASIDRFSEILALGADITEDDAVELAEIIESWASAPDVAAELDAPAGLEDIQTAYEDFADELTTAADAIAEYQEQLEIDPESAETEAAFTDFILAVASAQSLYTELEELLADAGA